MPHLFLKKSPCSGDTCESWIWKLHSVALDRFISLILSSLLGKMENILPTQQCVCGWWWGVSFYLHNNMCVGAPAQYWHAAVPVSQFLFKGKQTWVAQRTVPHSMVSVPCWPHLPKPLQPGRKMYSRLLGTKRSILSLLFIWQLY